MEIEDLLKSMLTLKDENAKGSGKSTLSARDIWDGLAERKDYKELGFDTEDALKEFLADNPYTSIQ